MKIFKESYDEYLQTIKDKTSIIEELEYLNGCLKNLHKAIDKVNIRLKEISDSLIDS